LKFYGDDCSGCRGDAGQPTAAAKAQRAKNDSQHGGLEVAEMGSHPSEQAIKAENGRIYLWAMTGLA
jgi:hypothetical protein